MPKMVVVGWRDAIHLPMHWQPLQEYLDKADQIQDRPHYTCGFLIKETDDYIVVCLDFTDVNANGPALVNMAQIIQKDMIISLTELDISPKS